MRMSKELLLPVRWTNRRFTPKFPSKWKEKREKPFKPAGRSFLNGIHGFTGFEEDSP